MKIVMVHPHDLLYDPWTIRILELARRLQRRGCEIALVHMPRKETPAHPPLRELEEGDPPVYALRPRQQHAASNFALLRSLAAGADVIHLQKCFPAATLPVLWTSRLLNKPLHYDWDDDETAISALVERRALARFHLASYESMTHRFADSITCASGALQARALAAGFDEARLRRLPVGADLERFHPRHRDREILREFGLDPARPTVLYVGQLEGAAHAHRLVEAAPLVLASAPDAQLLLAGGGEQLDDLRRAAAELPARASIRVGGYVASQRVPTLVGAADVCVACFDDVRAARAKSPLKIAEYLAAGKAIVASRVGDAPWMIEGCGLAVTPESAEALAEGILSYLTDPARRARDGERARRRAEDLFNWDRGADTLMELYGIISTRG
ncbi:MAG: glycosyltransferase [bacterium]|nr:glycosyltransferase [bacterium]